jgi:hypothetical protein
LILIILVLSREFMQCDEKTTIWGNSYETSIAKSEGSSDGSQTSKKLSFDFTSSTMHTTSVTVTSMVLESDKENIVEAKDAENFIIPANPKESLDGGSRTNSLNNSSGFTNMTVEIRADEKKRIKNFGTDNLNMTTNINLDMSLMTQVKATEERMVLSPRKTIYFNDNANISVCIQDKVLMKESEAAKKDISDSCEFTLEEDEKVCFKSERKTTHKINDMDLTLETSKVVPVPKIFKLPETPKPFRMAPRFRDISMNLDSPPIKPPKLPDQKQVASELEDFMLTETPTKNLCRQMCGSKKHSITPLQNQPPAKTAKAMERLTGRNSMHILKDLGLDLGSPKSQKAKNDESSMDLEEVKMDLEPEKPRNRQTVFDASIVIEPTTSSLKEARKTLFEEDMNETLSQKTAEQLSQSDKLSQKVETLSNDFKKFSHETFFDLDIEETVAGTKSVTLVKLKDLPAPLDSPKRRTVYNNDISFTCNFADMAAFKPCSTMMNCSNMDETGVSESTNELARKASRLLRDPMATTSSNSHLNDIGDISIDSPHQRSLPAESYARKTVYDTNMSLNLNSPVKKSLNLESPVKTLPEVSMKISPVSKRSLPEASFKLSPLKYVTSNEMDISGIEPTADISKTNLQKPRGTIYGDSSIHENLTPQASVKVQGKSRGTIYANQTMQEDSTPQASVKVQGKSRGTIYANQSIQEDSSAQTSSKHEEKFSRKTIYGDDTITETSIIQHQHLKKPHRDTIYGSHVIDETNVGDMSFDLSMEVKKNQQITIYKDSPIEEEKSTVKEITTPVKAEIATKNRKTIHETLAINETNIEEEEMTRHEALTPFTPNLVEIQQVNSMSRFGSTSFNDKSKIFHKVSTSQPEVSNRSLSPCVIPPPPEFNTPIYDSQIFLAPQLTEHQHHEMDVSSMLRESVIVAAPKDVSHRRTVHESINMEVEKVEEVQESGDQTIHENAQIQLENQTFTVGKVDEHKKLMNITDADIHSLIDDESNPCINESREYNSNESQSSDKRRSFGGNISIYQNALQEFVNITIMNSPLNASSYAPTPAPLVRTKKRVIPTAVDYCSKLDDLIESLEKKDEPAPRLAIDEFLEKLNIRPVKIPFHPELEPDWLAKEDEKVKARIVQDAAKRKERIAAAELLQQPLIPSYQFLLKNKLEQ